MVVWIKNHLNNSLFQNTYILIAMRVVSSGCSYLFWIIAARTLIVHDVGLASGSVSSSMLLAGFAHLGLGYGLVRQLAHSENPKALINFSLLTAGLAGLGLGLLFLLGLPIWSPKLLPLLDTFYTLLVFVLLVVSTALSRIFFNIFLASRRMKFGLIKQTIQSVMGVVLILACRGMHPGYLGPLTAYTFSLVLSLGASFAFLSVIEPGYQFSFSSNVPLFSSFTRYSFINYLQEQVQTLPTSLLPLLTLNILGPSAGAFFSIPWSMGRGLVSLAGSVSETLFSEGSNDPENVSAYTRKSAQFAFLVTLGMVAGTIVGGRLILSLYGLDYLRNSLWLLYFVAFAVLPEVLIMVMISFLRIRDRLKSVSILLSVSSFLGLALGAGGLVLFGLNGAGIGWLASKVLVLLSVFIWQRAGMSSEQSLQREAKGLQSIKTR